MNNSPSKNASGEAEKTTSEDTGKKSKYSYFNVRDSLTSMDAIRKYDKYVLEHKRRLTQLYREARGEMSPSVDHYDE